MKRKDTWRDKLDASGLQLLDGHHSLAALKGKVLDDADLRSKVDKIVSAHPQLKSFQSVDVLPEFVQLLFSSEHLAPALSDLGVAPGEKVMSPPTAQFVEVMQSITMALEKHGEFRIAAGIVTAALLGILGGIYSDISDRYFGDAGPTEAKDLIWVVGTTLEVLGKSLKSGKMVEVKGRINVELIQLITKIQEHQTAKLSYRELLEALNYAGLHVADEEALRVFVFRARKKGWIPRP